MSRRFAAEPEQIRPPRRYTSRAPWPDLPSRQLETRARDLASANRELESFTSSISHIRKTPLRAIAGYSPLRRQDYLDALDGEGRLLLRYVHQGLRQMSRLIEDPFAWLRPERRSIAAVPLTPGVLLRGGVAGFQPRLQSRCVALSFDVGGVFVITDPVGFRMSRRNRIGNALKFTGRGGHPRIEIGRREEERSAVFFVSGNGIGFGFKDHGRVLRSSIVFTAGRSIPVTATAAPLSGTPWIAPPGASGLKARPVTAPAPISSSPSILRGSLNRPLISASMGASSTAPSGECHEAPLH